jgi:hypothetical protein
MAEGGNSQMSKLIVVLLATSALAACARSSIMPLAQDAIQISTSAAPICGQQGAQEVAVRRAAIETINRGYDRFLVIGANAENNVRVIGHTAGTATTFGTATATTFGNTTTAVGRSTTIFNQGAPILGGTHDQNIAIQMFRDDDPAGANAISARETLGPDWAKIIKQSTATTC